MKHKLGVTLIEILVAIALIALLLTILYSLPPGKALRTSQANAKMVIVSSYLRKNYVENQRWPDQEKWIKELKVLAQEDEIENWDSLFIDGWKNPIQYRVIEENDTQTVLLYSYGKNQIDDNRTGDDIVREVDIPTQEDINNYKANTESAAGN